MTSILITGGAGFIGSNFIHYLIERYDQYKIITLDLLTYAGSKSNLADTMSHPRLTFIEGDIADRNLVESIFAEYDIKKVIHFAAESHVDNSIATPNIFVRTNVMGTFTLIDVAYKYWMEAPNIYKRGYSQTRFHHISTDEVYGTLGETGLFTEKTAYAPNSPYSASKASSDMIVRSYYHTYGMNTLITNCSNNYGPRQHHEKLIPTIIQNAIRGTPIPVYGDGLNVRDWLYVADHCRGVDIVFHKGKVGETYNIGGKNEQTNLEVVNKICNLLNELVPASYDYKNLIRFVKDRAGHDRRYAIDATKVETQLGWKAQESFDSGLKKTIHWYLEKL